MFVFSASYGIDHRECFQRRSEGRDDSEWQCRVVRKSTSRGGRSWLFLSRICIVHREHLISSYLAYMTRDCMWTSLVMCWKQNKFWKQVQRSPSRSYVDSSSPGWNHMQWGIISEFPRLVEEGSKRLFLNTETNNAVYWMHSRERS